MSRPAAQGQSADAAVPSLADQVAAAVTGCSGVVSLSSGGFHPVATYLPGRQVTGVHIDDRRIQVAVVGVLGMPIPVLAAQVRAALVPFAGNRVVDVDVVDVQAVPDLAHPYAPLGPGG